MEGILGGLSKFIEGSASESMPDAAAELVDLMESDAIEPISEPTGGVPADAVAERLETRIERLKQKGDDSVDGMDLLEDAVAHIRQLEEEPLFPWTFEDGEGVRWFVLSSEDEEVVACYTSRPFIEADI